MNPVENLTYSDFSAPARKPSAIIPKLMVNEGERFECPKCRYQTSGLEHDKESVCPGCGLILLRLGNELRIRIPD